MTLDEYNAFCAGLPATTYVVQWGGAHVWKVGGKVFAICGWSDDERVAAVTFKVSALTFEILQQMPGLRPAPYLASRGMTWIQHFEPPGLDDEALRQHIEQSYNLIVSKLTQKLQRELGIGVGAPAA